MTNEYEDLKESPVKKKKEPLSYNPAALRDD